MPSVPSTGIGLGRPEPPRRQAVTPGGRVPFRQPVTWKTCQQLTASQQRGRKDEVLAAKNGLVHIPRLVVNADRPTRLEQGSVAPCSEHYAGKQRGFRGRQWAARFRLGYDAARSARRMGRNGRSNRQLDARQPAGAMADGKNARHRPRPKTSTDRLAQLPPPGGHAAAYKTVAPGGPKTQTQHWQSQWHTASVVFVSATRCGIYRVKIICNKLLLGFTETIHYCCPRKPPKQRIDHLNRCIM